jgi:hypothetical protein
MAGLLDIFGSGGGETLGLLGMSPENIQQARDDAQAQALYGLAARLFQGGNTGQSIAEGLQQGQKLYKSALQNQMQEQLQGFQVQDMLRKRKLEEQALARQAMIDRAVAGAYQPAVQAQPAMFYGQETQLPIRDDQGNLMPFATEQVQGRSAGLDLQSLYPLLMTSREGTERLSQLAKVIPEARKAGFMGGATIDNPFLMFSQDQTVPENIRSLANQYAKSFANGLIDPEKADERIRQLSEMTQRVQQFEQTQTGLKQQREATNTIAQGNQEIQRMMAMAKLEEKQAKTEEKATAKAEAKDQLTATVGQLKKSYDTLLNEGGIVSTQATPGQNISARLSSSGVGQAVGGAVGTKTQEQRQIIEQTRPLLLNLIKNATGMSAQQMNSNAEMQLYLNAATNPKLSYEANMEALANLDRLYGLGDIAKDIQSGNKKQKQPTQTRGGW